MRIWIWTLLGTLAWTFFSRAYFAPKFCPACFGAVKSYGAADDTLAQLPHSSAAALPESPLAVSAAKMTEEGQTFHFDNMTFEDASADSSSQAGDFHLSPQFVAYSDSLAAFCLQFPKTKVTLTGFTNTSEKETSKNRAEINWPNSVKRYLTTKGLSENQLTVVSKLINERRLSVSTGKAVKKRLQISVQRAG